MARKPCLDCRRLSLASRCPEHAAAWRARRGPGWTAKAKRVIARQPWCSECGVRHTPENPLTADHIVPVSRGGSNDEANLRTVCRSHNSSKGDR